LSIVRTDREESDGEEETGLAETKDKEGGAMLVDIDVQGEEGVMEQRKA